MYMDLYIEKTTGFLLSTCRLVEYIFLKLSFHGLLLKSFIETCSFALYRNKWQYHVRRIFLIMINYLLSFNSLFTLMH